jgi:hypothetical protein
MIRGWATTWILQEIEPEGHVEEQNGKASREVLLSRGRDVSVRARIASLAVSVSFSSSQPFSLLA